MNLDELRSVQSKERQKDSLQNLRPSFYQEVGEYIAELEAERDRAAERAEDPFSSPEVSRLTDEIETAKDVVEAIYERRMGKLVKQASLAAAGMPADDEGLTAEEADLFDDLVDRIESNKSRVLDVLEGGEERADPATASDPEAVPERAAEGPAGGHETPAEPSTDRTAEADTPPAPPQEPPAESAREADAAGAAAPDEPADSSGISPADVMGGEDASVGESAPIADRERDRDTGSNAPADAPPRDSPDDRGADGAAERETTASAAATNSVGADGADDGTDVNRVTVRITRDVGSILGVDDREYTLSADDIVYLPEENATPLVEQEAAEPLE
ncbi:hypothetical protein [Halopiger djelfimassiliensis]|uniref:hypothetical protein n=1 Tax=Halopiger djelfimassiliensis TaxID=1293047 RepID=UPI000677AE50|nr:hypothetical protein [Halopiger djelfimassiliensis]